MHKILSATLVVTTISFSIQGMMRIKKKEEKEKPDQKILIVDLENSQLIGEFENEFHRRFYGEVILPKRNLDWIKFGKTEIYKTIKETMMQEYELTEKEFENLKTRDPQNFRQIMGYVKKLFLRAGLEGEPSKEEEFDKKKLAENILNIKWEAFTKNNNQHHN